MSTKSTREPSDELPVDVPSVNAQSDVEKLKEIMEVYKMVFKTFTECQPHVSIESVSIEGFSTDDEDAVLPVYTMTANTRDFDDADRLTTGLLALPDGTHQSVRDAWMNFLLCDTFVVMFLEAVSKKLHEMGAHVQWHLIMPRPKFLLRYPFEKMLHRKDTLHSVMSIELPNGEQYVIDFTGAQLGFKPAHWFMTQEKYIERYVQGDRFWLTDDDRKKIQTNMDVAWKMPCYHEGKRWVVKVREVASNLDWAALENLTQLQRLETVQAEAKAVFDEFRSSGAWRVEPPSSI